MPITRGSDSNNSGLVVLGRRNIVFAAFLLLPPELLFNPDRFMFEGNSIPCQSEYLTLSKDTDTRGGGLGWLLGTWRSALHPMGGYSSFLHGAAGI